MTDSPRVRFAPSPTGYLHVGGLRTALYNYLFAKKNNGKFILRIEDTDRNRFVEGAAEKLIETFKWVGLDYDEGPGIGGECGPYFQSERLDIYKKYAEELIKNKKAYYAFDTPERLQELRESQYKEKLQPKYDKAALELSEEEVKEKLNSGMPYVVRLNVTPGSKVVINDKVRGRVEFDRAIIDDQILVKSDGFPTYHLANVVDDHLMGITHVIRGEEWLSSTPKHVLLYEYLGWELPEFAHLPLLLNPDKSKLSKRQGDVAVEDYKDKGFLKESLVNFVALLGWSAGDNKEVYNIEELINEFNLERVHKAGAVFDQDKLNWINEEQLRSKPVDYILEMFKEELQKSKYKDQQFEDSYLKNIISAMIERVSFVYELVNNCNYFYEAPTEYDEALIKKKWKVDTPNHLKAFADSLQDISGNDKEEYEAALKQTAEKLEVGAGKLIFSSRLAVSGIGSGPGIYDLLYIVGKDEVIKRINTAIEKISI